MDLQFRPALREINQCKNIEMLKRSIVGIEVLNVFRGYFIGGICNYCRLALNFFGGGLVRSVN